MNTHIYIFGEFSLDGRQQVLFRNGKPVSLTPKAFQTLFYLVENHGRLVEKGELISAVWADSFVEEGNLTYNIRQLRKGLGDDAHNPIFIETVARRGYRFIADVEILEDKSAEIVSEENRADEIEKNEDSIITPETSQIKNSYPKKLKWLIPVAAIFLFVVVTAFVMQRQKPARAQYLWSSDETVQPFSSVKFKKITEIGQATVAAISPDGKLIAYSNMSGGKQSLWLRQLATSTSIQIVPASNENFYGLQFSSDGEFIYFLKTGLRLFRVSVFGGAPTLVSEDAGGFSLSPDNKQIAFVRNLPGDRCAIMIADIDNDGRAKDERVFAVRSKPSCYKNANWSPDGKVIIAPVGQSDTGDSNTQLIELSVADGRERSFSSGRWYFINYLQWIPDQSGLILTGRDKINSPVRIWQVSYPSGEVRQLTNDAASYSHVSLTQDSTRLLAVQITLNSHLEIAPSAEPTKTRRLTPAFLGFSWLSEDKVTYSPPVTTNSNLWAINTDGSQHEQLTFSEFAHFHPSAAPDGKFIVFVLAKGETNHVWRMDVDGSNKIQLTNGGGEQSPVVSPDGKYVFYQDAGKTPSTIWRVSIDGGEPEQIVRDAGSRPSISPDGKFMAYFRRDDTPKREWEIVLFSLENSQIIRTFKIADGTLSTLKIRWTKDGKNLAYATETNEFTANIWLQPIDDSPPRRITDFTAERIFDFDWSPNDKWLGIIRGSWNHEVVLISRN